MTLSITLAEALHTRVNPEQVKIMVKDLQRTLGMTPEMAINRASYKLIMPVDKVAKIVYQETK